MAFSSLEAQIAAHESWARTADRSARTHAARMALEAKFAKLVDPDLRLPEPVRAQMVESARKAHYRRLALKSAQSRRRHS